MGPELHTLRLVPRPPSGLEEIEIALLLEGVFRRYGFDFREYARTALRRRILERVREEQALTVSRLQEKLLRDPRCFERFVTAVSANVTTLFRDPPSYRVFRSRIVPWLRGRARVRLWHVGCANGEEVYSMAVLLQEEGLEERTQVYATDLHEATLRQAAAGVFPLDRLRAAELSYRAAGGRASLSDYYRVEAGQGVFRPELRRNVLFAAHNLVTDGSFNEFDVIFCRNVLPYLSHGLQSRVHRLLYDSLACPGFLALGRREDLKLTPFEGRYAPIDSRNGFFRRVR